MQCIGHHSYVPWCLVLTQCENQPTNRPVHSTMSSYILDIEIENVFIDRRSQNGARVETASGGVDGGLAVEYDDDDYQAVVECVGRRNVQPASERFPILSRIDLPPRSKWGSRGNGGAEDWPWSTTTTTKPSWRAGDPNLELTIDGSSRLLILVQCRVFYDLTSS